MLQKLTIKCQLDYWVPCLVWHSLTSVCHESLFVVNVGLIYKLQVNGKDCGIHLFISTGIHVVWTASFLVILVIGISLLVLYK